MPGGCQLSKPLEERDTTLDGIDDGLVWSLRCRRSGHIPNSQDAQNVSHADAANLG